MLVDRGFYEELSCRRQDDEGPADKGFAYTFRRTRRTSVKGYSRLQSWALRRASE